MVEGEPARVNVLVSYDFQNTTGYGGLNMNAVFRGETTKVDRTASEEIKRMVKEMNVEIMGLRMQKCPEEYVQRTLRRWIPRPYGSGKLYF
jgi:hypothetical protein